MAKKTADIQDQWDLTLLFKNDKDPAIAKLREEVQRESYDFINKWNPKLKSGFRDDYLKDPKILAKALKEYEKWIEQAGNYFKEGYYLHLKSSLDQNDTDVKAWVNKLTELVNKMQNDIRFFHYRVSKIDIKLQPKFLKSAELKNYKHFLEELFKESSHLLTEDQEKIMNLKSKVSYDNWVQMTAGFLAKEEREVLNEKGKIEKKNFNEILSLIDNESKKVRDSAAKALNDIFNRWIDVGEQELNSIFEDKKVDDDLRKYSRPDEARHLADDIDTEVVDALNEAVTKRFETAKKYYKLKAKLLGLKKLQYHERNLEYGKFTKKYSYSDAKEIIGEVFNKLDPKFYEIFNGFVDERRVDVYPKQNKYSGAFCTYGVKGMPVFILLNYTDQLDDVRTFAHELGHGIHFTLMAKQSALYSGVPMSTAEVASTFMEDFVTQKLMAEADDEARLSLMMNKLNNNISTIHRQIACYNFEYELHKEFREKGYLSKENIGQIFLKNMKAYIGPAVELTEGSENWWLGWSHIRNFFYVYSYASGLLISKSLQHFVKEDPTFIKKVIEFFEAGSSESPKAIFKKLGIDITDKDFWNKGLNEIDALLVETESLAKKLGKI